jgi:AcrR family transcriptional regulator
MPRTRVQQSRHAKIDEILSASERRLLEGGFEALSVADIARELGIAQNAVYWYFPSKDHLFVATLERILQNVVARKPSHRQSDLNRILWFTDQFGSLSGLRAAMNDRARVSPVVAEFVERLDALLSRMLSGVLANHVSADSLPLAVDTFRATVEGTFVKQLGKRERRRVLTFALERLMQQPGALDLE